MRDFDNFAAVVVGIAAHDDLRAFACSVEQRITDIFQMLVRDVAVVVEDFIIPVRKQSENAWNVIGIGNTPPKLPIAYKIQAIVPTHGKVGRKEFRDGKVFKGVVEVLAMVKGIGQNSRVCIWNTRFV